MNIPYVKKYDENGVLVNPIKGSYKNVSKNRRQRKSLKNRFKSNKKGVSLTVINGSSEGVAEKYYRVVQTIIEKSGNIKRIEHYILNSK